MFRLRIHSVDDHHHVEASQGSLTQEETSRDPQNPRIHEIRGITHLYRNISHHPTTLDSLPIGRSTLLFFLGVPNRMSTEDFLRFCGSYLDHVSEIRVVRNDGMDDRYSVLINLDDQKSADIFYRNLNCRRFPEAEVCHILFTTSVEYTESTEIAGTPPTGCIELPTCPVCLERLDQDTSGILTALCDHSFQCSCFSKWTDSSCPVCRFCQQQPEKLTCSVCETSEDLWICMICGFVGCGRYKEGHAIQHWNDTQHCYSLDLRTQRVWDYVGDTYVHRLNQSKTDGKSVELNSYCRSIDDDCGAFESEESGVNGALLSSKVEVIVDEYNSLLASQLENQRQYYETLLSEAKGKRDKAISEAVEKAVSLKLQNIQLELEKCTEEKKIAAGINENLMKKQDLLRKSAKEIEERAKSALRLRDEKILDLEEQIRDFMVYLKAQKTLDNMIDTDEIRGGTLLPTPLQEPSSANSKRPAKTNRRRN